ncbi:vacuolar protein-sorting-associated protein 36-like [Anthonomus grandis grandis]|uniref:vacuolar protein-sorting-associated protein 36-like n=1 Tax=Anthonomus grandis grandis TaxID=2921223 RepID=UPI002165844C|nr:vacuolar protein-sorting-associated protein 36-like [Anthonomus grandis grandis]
MKVLSVLGCLLVAVHANTYKGQRTTLEDIERDLSGISKSITHPQTKKAPNAQLSSPTKFGFIPHRTASSYAASKPKLQYTQGSYQVKPKVNQPSTYQKPLYQTAPALQYVSPDQTQQYSQTSQQYLNQQQAQEYTYIQPDTAQQYVQYQEPSQQYSQYDNIQYVTDNSIGQQDGKQSYYSQQPQYYYVQYQAPSTAVESVVEPKASTYSNYLPSNAIPVEEKQQYFTAVQQLPPITTTVAKYTTVVPKKPKHTSQQYRSQQTSYYPQEEAVPKREPKSLLDSYVPSVLQLQYLRQYQGKGSQSKY